MARRYAALSPKTKLPGHTSCVDRAIRYIRVGFPPSPCASCPEWVPAMLPALGRISANNPSRVWNHLPGGTAPILVAASVRASSLRLSGRLRRPAAATVDGRPACRDQSPCNPLRQRLGTGAGTSCLDGAAVGACLVPTVIRCRFRSTVAVPIPFTRVRSSTRRKGPCWRRYVTIAWALTGPTFVNPCSSAAASAVLMLIRSAVQAAPLNNSPSTSALHDFQSPTV